MLLLSSISRGCSSKLANLYSFEMERYHTTWIDSGASFSYPSQWNNPQFRPLQSDHKNTFRTAGARKKSSYIKLTLLHNKLHLLIACKKSLLKTWTWIFCNSVLQIVDASLACKKRMKILRDHPSLKLWHRGRMFTINQRRTKSNRRPSYFKNHFFSEYREVKSHPVCCRLSDMSNVWWWYNANFTYEAKMMLSYHRWWYVECLTSWGSRMAMLSKLEDGPRWSQISSCINYTIDEY